jgi:puromycin-sensitive aminopeptidase
VTPSRYELLVAPDLDDETFTGSIRVSIDVHEPVTEIVLNALELELSDGRLLGDAGRVVEVAKTRLDPEAQRAHLELPKEIEAGPWTLELSFSGRMNPRLTGFYVSTYEQDGVVHKIGSTHFESTDARRAFPCWDEPDLKAVWSITLDVPQGLLALSNAPEVDRESIDLGRVRVRFADTIPMSSYLVAYVVGRLELTRVVDAAGVPMRVAHVPGRGHLAEFALDVGRFSVEWFTDYYGVPYPDAKIDHVAVPDFAQGAMENLGCITYREHVLLVDPVDAAFDELVDVADTITHELAHMWFGDLVTMRWWNGIWLNEAFAEFMSWLCLDAYRPEWRVWDAFHVARTTALDIDSLETTRPIEYPVQSPEDASGMFDTLTYTKGGAVLRMLERWLGADRFRDGIRRYLREHAYGNTETTDLWDALEAETGEPVRRIMDAWIFQGGYPSITLTREGDALRLRQRRFAPGVLDESRAWPVPLVVRQVHGDRTRSDRVLVERGGLELPLLHPDALVVGNADAVSFVRTWYGPDLLARLRAGALEHLSTTERLQLVDDAWAAVVAGSAPVAGYLDLVRELGDEPELPVWRSIVAGLRWCERFAGGQAREGLRAFVRELLGPTISRLGWEPRDGEAEPLRALRGLAIAALGVVGADPETIARSHELEAEYAPGSGIDPAVAAAAIVVVASTGDRADYERYRERSRSMPTPQEQERYLYALARFEDDELAERTLAATLTDEIRAQDAPFVLRTMMAANRAQGERAFRFVAERWDDVLERFAASNIIALATQVRWLTSPEIVAFVQGFFRDHDIPQNHLMLQQHLERQRVAAAVHRRVEPELDRYFAG